MWCKIVLHLTVTTIPIANTVSRARKGANKSFRYSLSEPKPFAKNRYIQNIKKVVSCDMKFMKELKDIFKTQQSSTYEKMSKWRCRQNFALLAA